MGYRDCADLRSFAAANGLDGKSDDEVGEARSNKFPMHICRAIVYIGALITHQDGEHWIADAPGAPHVGERPEKKLIASFVERFLVIPSARSTVATGQRLFHLFQLSIGQHLSWRTP